MSSKQDEQPEEFESLVPDTPLEKPYCDNYKILRTLGRGGNAVVKLVERRGKQYAMKLFQPHKTEREAFFKETEAEFNIVSSLKLKAIPRYIEWKREATWVNSDGDERKVAYLVMEHVDGVELIDLFNQIGRPTTEPFLRHIFKELAMDLHTLHNAGVAHRDIKPENIIFTHNYEIKLIDLGYGISLAGRQEDGFNRTRLGTKMYMAPEVVENQPY